MSDVQRRQMTTVLAPNVHNIAIDGSFDDAQALVKAMFNDRGFSGRFTLSAVNSHQLGAVDGAGRLLFLRRRAAGRTRPPGRLLRSDRQFRRCVRRLCRGAHGPAHRQADRRDQRQRHPAPRAVAVAIIRRAASRRPRHRRWIFRSAPTSNGCCSTWTVATARRSPRRCSGFEATKAMRLTNAQQQGAAASVRQRPGRSRRDGGGDALGTGRVRADDRSAHRHRSGRRARCRSARRRARRDAGDGAPGQVPRRRRARDRRAPRPARSGWATCSSARNALRRCPARSTPSPPISRSAPRRRPANDGAAPARHDGRRTLGGLWPDRQR